MGAAFELAEEREGSKVLVLDAADLEHAIRTHRNALCLSLATAAVDAGHVSGWVGTTLFSEAVWAPRRTPRLLPIKSRVDTRVIWNSVIALHRHGASFNLTWTVRVNLRIGH
jgi:hypothetical protein